MHPKAEKYLNELQLMPHPEGGYFKEVYRSDEIFNAECLPNRYDKDKCFATSIYFMLEGSQASIFHRLKSDEVWHFYDGSAVIIYLVDENGILHKKILGKDFNKGEAFQAVIPKGNWFAAELEDISSFCLIGCSVSPGFDYEDFDLGDRNYLLKLFPQHSELIKKLTKLEQ